MKTKIEKLTQLESKNLDKLPGYNFKNLENYSAKSVDESKASVYFTPNGGNLSPDLLQTSPIHINYLNDDQNNFDTPKSWKSAAAHSVVPIGEEGDILQSPILKTKPLMRKTNRYRNSLHTNSNRSSAGYLDEATNIQLDNYLRAQRKALDKKLADFYAEDEKLTLVCFNDVIEDPEEFVENRKSNSAQPHEQESLLMKNLPLMTADGNYHYYTNNYNLNKKRKKRRSNNDYYYSLEDVIGSGGLGGSGCAGPSNIYRGIDGAGPSNSHRIKNTDIYAAGSSNSASTSKSSSNSRTNSKSFNINVNNLNDTNEIVEIFNSNKLLSQVNETGKKTNINKIENLQTCSSLPEINSKTVKSKAIEKTSSISSTSDSSSVSNGNDGNHHTNDNNQNDKQVTSVHGKHVILAIEDNSNSSNSSSTSNNYNNLEK